MKIARHYKKMRKKRTDLRLARRRLHEVYRRWWGQRETGIESGATKVALRLVPVFDVDSTRIVAGINLPYSRAYAALRRRKNKPELLAIPPEMAKEIARIIFDHMTQD